MAWALCGLLVLLVVLVFGQTATFGFINLDDDQYVTQSAATQLGLSAAGIAWAWQHSQVGNWHPLTTMSFMLDWQLFGMKAGGYHLHNVLLHAASVVLLFLLLRRMTGAMWRSLLAAAVFAIHPLRAESVAWVAERKDVLSGFYFLLTLWAYVVYVRRPSRWRYLAVLLFFALGLMCKAMLVTLPVPLLVLDYWPLKRFETGAGESEAQSVRAWKPWLRRVGKLAGEKLALLVLAVGFSALTMYLSLSAERVEAVLPLWVRLAIAPVSAVTYLGQMLCPWNLAAHYPYSAAGPSGWRVAAACLVLGAISAGAWAVRRKRPYVLMGWLWYVVTLLPVIGLVPGGNQMRADRYTYLTQIGLYVTLVWAVGERWLSWSPRIKRSAALGGAVLVAGLMVLAWRQTSYWRDSERLWRHALTCTSENAVAHEHLADALTERAREAVAKHEYQLAQAQVAEAKENYQQALAIMPQRVPSLCNLGGMLCDEGKLDEAIGLFDRAIAANPRVADAHYNLANALLRKGSVNEAIRCYQRALELSPNHAAAHNNLANVLADTGKLEEAIVHYRQAIAANPRHVDAYNNLGNALLKQGKVAEAEANYRRALAIEPKLADAYRNLADLYRNQGGLNTAVQYYQSALQADGHNVVACNNLGDVLNRLGKNDEAIVVYRQAVGLAPQSAVVRYNLGVCLERKGSRDEALACLQQALALAEGQKDAPTAELIREKIRALSEAGR
jgi:protein O-mannosyl-transferase